MNKFLLIPFLIAIVFFSCKRDVEVFEAGDYYTPIRPIGSYIVYDVHRIIYDATGRDTFDYQLMEKIGDTITLNGRLYYKILRYTRLNDFEDWPAQPDSVWKTYKLQSQYVRNENNVDIIKLVFPIDEGKSWDANALNSMGSQNYTMKKIAYPYSVNNHNFSNTLTVMEKYDTSAINKNISMEVYSKDLGLIYKSVSNLELCQSAFCIINHNAGKDSILTGEKYEQKFNSYQ